MLGVVGSSLKMVKLEPKTPSMSQHIATRWPSAFNTLRPTMLRCHVAIVWPGLKRPHGKTIKGGRLRGLQKLINNS